MCQKKAKFLHTRAKYLNGFAEKAEELLGMSRKQFEDEFWNIPASQLTIGLPPTFSKAFVGYVEYRESTLFGEEEQKLKRHKRHRDGLLENQKGIAEELKNVIAF
jgi:chitinase